MLVVGLTALNLGGAVASWRSDVPVQASEDLVSDGRSTIVRDGNGQRFLSEGDFETGFRLSRVLREPPPPTRLQVWAPLVASVSFTVLILAVRWRPSAARPRHALRWIAIGAALTGVNLAAAVYRPFVDPTESWLANQSLHDRRLILRADGTTEHRPPGEPWVQESGGVSVSRLEEPAGRIGTIVRGIDGSIVAYEGAPGGVASRPYVIRQALRSDWEMRWPIVAAAFTTIVAIALLWSQHGRPGTDRLAGIDDLT
jgi:hypothetical protein